MTVPGLNGVKAISGGDLYSLAVGFPPAPETITSPNVALFYTGHPDTFVVTATRTKTITESGPLPAGVTFADQGNGVATLSGSPPPSAIGSYPMMFTADNGIAPSATQAFTLEVAPFPEPPQLVVASPRNAGAFVTWQPPLSNGNSPPLSTSSPHIPIRTIAHPVHRQRRLRSPPVQAGYRNPSLNLSRIATKHMRSL